MGSEGVQLYQIAMRAASAHVKLQEESTYYANFRQCIHANTCLPSLLRATDDTAPDTFVEQLLLRLGNRTANVPSPDPTSNFPFGNNWRAWTPQLSLFF